MRALLLLGFATLACAGAGGQTATRAPEGLSQQQIQEVVQSKMKVIEGCAVIAEATSGSLTIAFEVAPNGSVGQVSVSASSVENSALEACLIRTFEKLEFPRAEASTRSEFPFRLKSKP